MKRRSKGSKRRADAEEERMTMVIEPRKPLPHENFIVVKYRNAEEVAHIFLGLIDANSETYWFQNALYPGVIIPRENTNKTVCPLYIRGFICPMECPFYHLDPISALRSFQEANPFVVAILNQAILERHIIMEKRMILLPLHLNMNHSRTLDVPALTMPMVLRTMCQFCKRLCMDPDDRRQRLAHQKKCEMEFETIVQQQMRAEAESRARSMQKVCGICRMKVLEQGRSFGIMEGCTHCFCLICIRRFRETQAVKDNPQHCYDCNVKSSFVVSSTKWLEGEERKHAIVRYRSTVGRPKCTFFEKNNTCPRGSNCPDRHELLIIEPEYNIILAEGDRYGDNCRKGKSTLSGLEPFPFSELSKKVPTQKIVLKMLKKPLTPKRSKELKNTIEIEAPLSYREIQKAKRDEIKFFEHLPKPAKLEESKKSEVEEQIEEDEDEEEVEGNKEEEDEQQQIKEEGEKEPMDNSQFDIGRSTSKRDSNGKENEYRSKKKKNKRNAKSVSPIPQPPPPKQKKKKQIPIPVVVVTNERVVDRRKEKTVAEKLYFVFSVAMFFIGLYILIPLGGIKSLNSVDYSTYLVIILLWIVFSLYQRIRKY